MTGGIDLSPVVFEEFSREDVLRVQQVVQATDLVHLDTTTVAPTKPRAGDVRLADGTNWDPGSGAGFYGYYGGAWSKLG